MRCERAKAGDAVNTRHKTGGRWRDAYGSFYESQKNLVLLRIAKKP